MIKRKRRSASILLSLILVAGLMAGYFVFFRSLLPSRVSPAGSELASEPVVLERPAGPALSLAEADEPLDLRYLQQFCPDQPDLEAPGLCDLEEDRFESLAAAVAPEDLACWQQIYDYAFGPLANQPYLGGDPPAGDDPAAEPVNCHQGAITVLVSPEFVSQVEADSNDAARYQDILFVISAIIEYEAYRGRVPTNWSQLDGMVNFSYYDPANVNLPGTWDTYPATTGAIPSLVSTVSGADQIAVDPETKQLALPTSGRWGDADQANDPQLLMIFHKAACTDGADSPVKLTGRRRYAAVYKPSSEEGFACHDF